VQVSIVPGAKFNFQKHDSKKLKPDHENTRQVTGNPGAGAKNDGIGNAISS
jgi:hypothetical protein